MSAVLYLLGGIVMSFIYGTILDKYQNYNKLLKAICILSTIASLIQMVVLPHKNAMLVIISTMFIGTSVVPMVTVGYTFAVELAFPVREELTNGIMIMI